MHIRRTIITLVTCFGLGCGDKTDECMSNDDCNEGQTCVITHDHEGDDHDHGGTCEDNDADE